MGLGETYSKLPTKDESATRVDQRSKHVIPAKIDVLQRKVLLGIVGCLFTDGQNKKVHVRNGRVTKPNI